MRFSLTGLALLLGCSLALPAPDASGDAAARSAREAFPTFGFSVLPPAGWTQIGEGGPNHAARWALTEADSDVILAVVFIEVMPLREGQTLSDAAAAMAKETGGTVHPAGAKVGGEAAVAIHVAPSDPTPERPVAPVYAVLTARGPYVYVIGGLAPAASAPSTVAAVDGLHRSWQWRELDAPVQHLQPFRSEPFPLFGLLRINVPAILRPYPVDRRGGSAMVGAYNYLRGRNDFMVSVQIAPVGGMEKEEARMKYREVFAQRLGLAQAFTWEPTHSLGVQRWLSTPAQVDPNKLPSGGPSPTIRVGIVPLNAKTTALVVFTLADAPPEELQAYLQVAEAILRTVEPLPPAPEEP